MASEPSIKDLQRRVGELERRLAEHAELDQRARAAEDRFESIFRTAPDPMSITRLDDGLLVDVNPSFESVSGYPRAELLGRTITQLGLYAGGAADHDAIMASLRSQREVANHALQVRRKDGELRECLLSARLLQCGGETLVLSTVHDATRAQAAEQALRSSERRLRQIIDLVPHFIFAKDQQGRFILVNQAVAEAYGTTVEHLTGSTDADFTASQEEVDHFRADDQQVIDSGHPKVIPVESITDANGNVRLLSTVKIPFTFSGASSPAVLGVAVDITERKRAEEALQRSEQQYRMLAENVADVIWTVDLSMRLTFVSPSISKVFGDAPEQWLNRRPEDYIAPESLPQAYAALQHELQHYGQPGADPNHFVTFELQMRRADGAHFYAEVNARLLRDVEGIPVGVIGITRDISERKQAELERRRLEEQLMQAQKMESVGRLAGGVAHDLNNMLTPILGYADLLYRELADDDRRRARVHEIRAAGERSRDLVQRLLTFARKQTFAVRPVDLSQLVAAFQPMVRRTLRENVSVETRLTSHPGAIDGDAGQLEQVLMNLVINAQDAMPEGGTLTIETSVVEHDEAWARQHEGTRPGTYVRLTVHDTGIGIANDIKPHLFEPFFTTKAPGQGTGLGLSTVYGIVRQHQGAVEVVSAPGSGAAFHLSFPRTGALSPRPPAVPEPAGGQRGQGTILVVEDEDHVRALTAEVLRQSGYTVLEAHDGVDATEVVQAHSGTIDVLLTDVILPGENGPMLYERLAAMRPGLCVLFMSGYAADVIGHHGVLQPGVSFIQKPFSTRALAARVAEVLARR